jgi:hypothetical protein
VITSKAAISGVAMAIFAYAISDADSEICYHNYTAPANEQGKNSLFMTLRANIHFS